MKINRFDLDSYNFNNCFKFNLVMNYQRLYYKWKLFVLSNISKNHFGLRKITSPLSRSKIVQLIKKVTHTIFIKVGKLSINLLNNQ